MIVYLIQIKDKGMNNQEPPLCHAPSNRRFIMSIVFLQECGLMHLDGPREPILLV